MAPSLLAAAKNLHRERVSYGRLGFILSAWRQMAPFLRTMNNVILGVAANDVANKTGRLEALTGVRGISAACGFAFSILQHGNPLTAGGKMKLRHWRATPGRLPVLPPMPGAPSGPTTAPIDGRRGHTYSSPAPAGGLYAAALCYLLHLFYLLRPSLIKRLMHHRLALVAADDPTYLLPCLPLCLSFFMPFGRCACACCYLRRTVCISRAEEDFC